MDGMYEDLRNAHARALELNLPLLARLIELAIQALAEAMSSPEQETGA